MKEVVNGVETGTQWESAFESGTEAITLSDLSNGRYRLVELKAPAGYAISTADTEFTVADGKVLDKNGAELTGEITFTIANVPGVALPNTGEPGDALYLLGGLSLVSMFALALLGQWSNRRKGRAH